MNNEQPLSAVHLFIVHCSFFIVHFLVSEPPQGLRNHLEADTVTLRFDGGTLLLTGPPALLDALPHGQFDPRTGAHRAEARWYRPLVEYLRAKQIPYRDDARQYQPTPWTLRDGRTPFPHQQEAVDLWWQQGGRGIVVLPTGTGKTFVAILAIAHAGRPALVVTPTIVLMNQWYADLHAAFGEDDRPAWRRLLRSQAVDRLHLRLSVSSTWNAGATVTACSCSTNAIICPAQAISSPQSVNRRHSASA